jgi:hypothetical protein
MWSSRNRLLILLGAIAVVATCAWLLLRSAGQWKRGARFSTHAPCAERVRKQRQLQRCGSESGGAKARSARPDGRAQCCRFCRESCGSRRGSCREIGARTRSWHPLVLPAVAEIVVVNEPPHAGLDEGLQLHAAGHSTRRVSPIGEIRSSIRFCRAGLLRDSVVLKIADDYFYAHNAGAEGSSPSPPTKSTACTLLLLVAGDCAGFSADLPLGGRIPQHGSELSDHANLLAELMRAVRRAQRDRSQSGPDRERGQLDRPGHRRWAPSNGLVRAINDAALGRVPCPAIVSVAGRAAANKICRRSTASNPNRSHGGDIGILQIAGIRAGDLRDSTVLFGAHPCPTIATAVQPGIFRSPTSISYDLARVQGLEVCSACSANRPDRTPTLGARRCRCARRSIAGRICHPVIRTAPANTALR